MTAVDIGICTFRRPAVTETLASLARLDLPPEVAVRVIVADNDEIDSACEQVANAAARLGLDLTYVHAPARNISVARNALLDAARAPWLAFLDDDETATPGWLAALLAEAGRGGWDAVLGPVTAVYGADAPGWIAAGDFHSTRPVRRGGRILKGYAGNVLLRRDAIGGLRFDPALGRLGGEDDDFFYRLTDQGGTIGYAEAALAYEAVPPGRATLKWLLKRSFRAGQTHATRLASRHAATGRLIQTGLAAAKGGACALGAMASALSPTARGRWLVRGALHAGVAARLAGVKTLQLY